MPINIDIDLPKTEPKPEYLTLDNFKRGVITLIDKSRLPKNALEKADNLFLVEDGQPAPRPGVDWFGTVPTTTHTNDLESPVDASGTNWTGPTNVTASDDSRAVYADTAQDNLIITNFGFSISSDATILGITVKVEGHGDDATGANRSVEVGATKDGTNLVGSRLSAQNLDQSTDATLTFGDASELFSTTFTPAEVNLSTFGIMLRAGNTNSGQREIDHVQVQITYSYEPDIDGFDYFDNDGTSHLLLVAGGYVHRSTNDGTTWTQCTGATLTAGIDVNMNQNGGFMYLTNGTDNIVRYDGTTTLQTYTALTTPSAPSVAETGLSGTGYNHYYKVSAVNSVGFSIASSASTVVQSSLSRDTWDSASNFVVITPPSFQGTQTRADIYISEDNVDFYYLASTSVDGATYKDDGTAIPVPSTLAPTANTSQGPKVEELANVGSRMYGVRDSANRHRIWFSGSGQYAGAFSSAYDGGYIDWQEGGKFIPVKVADYRDGKGDPYATVWCNSADGRGCILQVTLETLTIGDISITVPSAYRLPGSRGTPAPGSVINVLNDFMFYNSQAFYNLGSRAQYLNLLSTDESSANIRPSVKDINVSGEEGVASAYFDAKVYFSVPYEGTTNSHTVVYDTERKAWLPKAFTLGFKKMIPYTDTGGIRRLLAIKSGDTRLSEIGEDISGDYGEPFVSVLSTGLYPVTKNRFEFQWTEEAEFELSNPQGVINIDLIGYDRRAGLVNIKSKSPSFTTLETEESGWDTFGWDVNEWDDTSTVPEITSESTSKRYFNVQKELNAIQWNITTTSLGAYYVLRTLQTWGTNTLAGKPRAWKIR